MPAQNIFDNLLLQGIRSGYAPARERDARNWYRTKAQNSNVTAENIIQKEKTRYRQTVKPGRMYLFSYDPKHKETLPFYDKYPLIFMVDQAKGGFYGINLHYLPHRLRAKLMDQLYSLVSNTKYDERTKLKMSYQLLNGISKFRYFKPCFKHYLGNHVRSRFIEIAASEWDIALMLPLQKFQKASVQEVWKQSKELIKS